MSKEYYQEVNKGKLFMLLTFLPAIVPSVIAGSIVRESNPLLVIVIATALYFWVFLGTYRQIWKVESYIKMFVISFALVTSSGVVMLFASEKDNAFAGAAFFLYLPSCFISYRLLKHSEAGKKAYSVYSSLYDKRHNEQG